MYGADPNLRAWLESVQTGYVLAVAKSTPICFTRAGAVRADAALKMLIAADWHVASAGAGSKGERRYAWAWIGTTDPHHHLVIRRSLVPNEKGIREVAFYLCFVPEGRPVTLRTLIVVAGRRWPVEEDFQVGKTVFGLDHSRSEPTQRCCGTSHSPSPPWPWSPSPPPAPVPPPAGSHLHRPARTPLHPLISA